MPIKRSELHVLMRSVLFLGLFGLAGVGLRADDGPAAGAAKAPANGDVQAIRKTAEAFEAAYRNKDANTIAAGFAPDGEVVDIEGRAVRGRAAIAEEFRRMFQEHPEAKLSLKIGSIRVVAPSVAIEDGTTKLVRGRNEPAVHTRYTAVHVKLDGNWLVASTRDLVPNTDVISISDRLKPLEFLIGDWIDESEEAVIATSYRWGEGRKSLMHDFTVKRAGAPVLKGTQRIGWDPLRHTIMSWTFDSRGGHSEGTWMWDRNHWLIKMNGVSAAGVASSATAFLTPLGHDSYRWESTDRVLGSEKAPDETVTIVRKPPEPHDAQNEAKTPPKP